jgi:hypothetical protein
MPDVYKTGRSSWFANISSGMQSDFFNNLLKEQVFIWKYFFVYL